VKAASRALQLYLKVIRDTEIKIPKTLEKLVEDLIVKTENIRGSFSMIRDTLEEIDQVIYAKEILKDLPTDFETFNLQE